VPLCGECGRKAGEIGRLRDGLQAFAFDKGQEFERGTLRSLFTTFPLADEASSYVEMTGENGLTGTFADSDGSDLVWVERQDRGEARGVEGKRTSKYRVAELA